MGAGVSRITLLVVAGTALLLTTFFLVGLELLLAVFSVLAGAAIGLISLLTRPSTLSRLFPNAISNSPVFSRSSASSEERINRDFSDEFELAFTLSLNDVNIFSLISLSNGLERSLDRFLFTIRARLAICSTDFYILSSILVCLLPFGSALTFTYVLTMASGSGFEKDLLYNIVPRLSALIFPMYLNLSLSLRVPTRYCGLLA
ncbi:hypothetical protein AYI69_g4727 [Smittium culicis]|uniref:Uncharacterized protein n=1 Tax=Smittium culicis TaxID=133412 RepID=A0A1R1YBC3_9FUNG|nr:hypothetical protein AYI69_g4727 [Smittium culicis]